MAKKKIEIMVCDKCKRTSNEVEIETYRLTSNPCSATVDLCGRDAEPMVRVFRLGTTTKRKRRDIFEPLDPDDIHPPKHHDGDEPVVTI